jgi:hypothetical protein
MLGVVGSNPTPATNTKYINALHPARAGLLAFEIPRGATAVLRLEVRPATIARTSTKGRYAQKRVLLR